MRIGKAALLVGALLVLQGCSVIRLFKAGEADDHGFVKHPETMVEQPEKRPFHRSWISKEATYPEAKQRYKALYMAPVDISVLEQEYAAEIEDEKERLIQTEEALELAKYFRNRLALVLRERGDYPLAWSDEKTADAFALELALVELSPTSPLINLAGTAAGYFVPGGGLIKYFGTGEIAMEGMIRDSATAEDYERFKDRESDKSSYFSIKDFQRYAHLRIAIDDWCDQFLEILEKPIEEDVSDSLPFTLNPF